VNTVTASFNIIPRQMTEMSQRKNSFAICNCLLVKSIPSHSDIVKWQNFWLSLWKI